MFRTWFAFPWYDPKTKDPKEIADSALYSAWEAKLEKVCDVWNADSSHNLQVYYLMSDGFDVALGKALNSDVLLFLLGYLLMIIYCTSALGKFDCVHSKRSLGVVGVSSVVLSVIGGIGLSCYLVSSVATGTIMASPRAPSPLLSCANQLLLTPSSSPHSPPHQGYPHHGCHASRTILGHGNRCRRHVRACQLI